MPKTSFKPDNINCSVFSCTSKASRERHLSFHKYPEYGENKIRIINKFGVEELLDRRVAWIKATQTTKKITRFMKVCSLHFKDDDFYPFALQPTAKRRKLKVNAVPSLNLPTESFDEWVFPGAPPKQLNNPMFPMTSQDEMAGGDLHIEHAYAIRRVTEEPLTKENRWTLSQLEALIDEYKKNPILFDIDHEEFNNEDLKIECLDNIVEALQLCRSGTTQADVVSQWNNLIQYVYGQRKLQETNLPKKSQSWYLQKLEFLKDHWQTREVKLELEEISDVDPLAPIMEVKIKEEIMGESPREKSDDESTISCEENDNKSSDDENNIFGTFVAAQLKKIASQEVQQDAIFEIHQVLHKALRENVELSNQLYTK